MTLLFDSLGWGHGAVDPSPPVPADGEGARRCREAALRYLLEVLHDDYLALAIEPLFERPIEAPRAPDPHAELVRFLCLAHRLLETELPLLRRVIRCQSAVSPRWMTAPRGGRVDPLATARASPLSPAAPQAWAVIRAERFADTPVNKLLATILRDTSDRIRRVKDHLYADADAMHREERLIDRVLTSIRRYLETSPLGEVPVALPPDPERLLGQALKRRAELQQVTSVVAWWRALQAIDLKQIIEAGRPESVSAISVHGLYELAVASSLLIALRRRLRRGPRSGGGGGVSFFNGAERFVVELGVRPLNLPGRPVTAAIHVDRPEGRSVLFIDARNAGGVAAHDAAGRLELIARIYKEAPVRCLLITPSKLSELAPEHVDLGVIPLDGLSGSAIRRWEELLDPLLSGGSPQIQGGAGR